MNSFTPYLTGALAFVGGFAGMYVYNVVDNPPTWLIVISSIVAYLVVGTLTARMCWPSISKSPQSKDGPPNEFIALLVLAFWPIALPISLIFLGNDK